MRKPSMAMLITSKKGSVRKSFFFSFLVMARSSSIYRLGLTWLWGMWLLSRSHNFDCVRKWTQMLPSWANMAGLCWSWTNNFSLWSMFQWTQLMGFAPSRFPFWARGRGYRTWTNIYWSLIFCPTSHSIIWSLIRLDYWTNLLIDLIVVSHIQCTPMT